MNTDYNELSMELFSSFFSSIAPQQSDSAVLLMTKTINAWQMGNTFVRLNDEEICTARELSPLVEEGVAAPLVLEGNCLFIGKVWAMEKDCAHYLSKFGKIDLKIDDENLYKQLQYYFPNKNDKEQCKAAFNTLKHRFSLITGGPGTGKTTTAAKILALLCQLDSELPHIAIAAPTGRAASHLQNSLLKSLTHESFPVIDENIAQYLKSLTGKTLHRLLNINPITLKTKYNEKRYLPYDCIIIDEASMIDLSMMNKLLRAISPKSRLILLGDAEQLPSVGSGAVLTQLVSQDSYLSVSRLIHSHRFHKDSGIGALAQYIRLGKDSLAIQCFSEFPADLSCIPFDEISLYNQLFDLQKDYWKAIDDNNIEQALSCFNNSMILCVYRNDVIRFNRGYRRFIKRKRFINDEMFCGRAIMVTRNYPSLNIYNGSIGIVMLDNNGKKQVFFAPDHFLEISRIPEYEDAFAMTVHKSQGSEYSEVRLLFPHHTDDNNLFDRMSLYTALTRAKKRFVYIGNMQALQNAIQTQLIRNSGLSLFLPRLMS